jgi:peptide-methionine (S)-S-oxide reductase
MHTSKLFALASTTVLVALVGCRSVRTSEGPDPTTSSAGSPKLATATGATEGAAKKQDPTKVGTNPGHVGMGTPLTPQPGHELAVFAAGCFWGVEENFRVVAGVTATAVGYTGGTTKNPSYEDVCSHTTGHAEAVLVEFDPKIVTYDELLRVFFHAHDPTQLNYQGPDHGDQYRSAIFTFDEKQAEAARKAMADAQALLPKKVVTVIGPVAPFYEAEEYHQQYDEKTGHPGCPVPAIWGEKT